MNDLTQLPRMADQDVAIVGGGQAGLSLSRCLRDLGVRHVVFEKHQALHVWSTQRWDHFCLVTPNWQCRLPGWHYRGDDPHGFMRKPELLEFLEGFKRSVQAPLREGVAIERVKPLPGGGFDLLSSEGPCRAAQVVVATGGYHLPQLPRMAERLPARIAQFHSSQYRNAEQLPPGRVLVVGSGQSGAQIAEDLHLAGREVVLAVGDAPRCARFYRGRDVVDWLADMGYYDMPVHQHPLREGVRDNTNHYVTGRDGGRDLDLRSLAAQGMQLVGALLGVEGDKLVLRPNLAEVLDQADQVYNRINASIDEFIASRGVQAPPGRPYEPVWQPAGERDSLSLSEQGIGSVVWCVGFAPDFSWLEAGVFNGRGQPVHERGVTAVPGLYFLGLPWLHTWGSGRFSGIARDAQFLASRIVEHAHGIGARAGAVGSAARVL